MDIHSCSILGAHDFFVTQPKSADKKISILINSLTAKSVPAGTKLVLFGRYVLNIYVGIVRYFLHKTKTWRAKIEFRTILTSAKKIQF